MDSSLATHSFVLILILLFCRFPSSWWSHLYWAFAQAWDKHDGLNLPFKFPWRKTWRILLAWTCVEVWFLLDSLYRWRGGRTERSQQTWRRCSAWLRLAGRSQFARVARLCQPAGHKSSHSEATYWRAACQWPEKRGGRKRDSPPVKGTTTRSTGAAKAPETKKKKTRTCLKAPPLIRACVSQYHRVLISSSRTLWGNIFLPAIPKQSE